MTSKQFDELKTLLLNTGISENEAFHIISFVIRGIDIKTQTFRPSKKFVRELKELNWSVYVIIKNFTDGMGLKTKVLDSDSSTQE